MGFPYLWTLIGGVIRLGVPFWGPQNKDFSVSRSILFMEMNPGCHKIRSTFLGSP